jgi:hypothetical protein
LSFFDEVDEPRTPPRTPPRRRRPSGSGRRPPGGPPNDQQAIQLRRGIAAAALLIVIVLIALGVRSCQNSAHVSALKDYSNNVASLIKESDQTGTQLFHVLVSGGGQGAATSIQNQINQTRVNAEAELSRARGIDVPDEVKGAQQNLLLALRMRADGIANIATEIQPALGTSTSKDAIYAIAAQMARFYASDVLYKGYTAPAIAAALHSAGIAVGAPNGQTISAGQFLPSIEWLQPSFIATELGTTIPGGTGTTGKATPGRHGHSLDSVSVNGTTLQTGSTNTIPKSPPPTFTLNFTNGGTNTEHNVVCKVSVTGTSVSGQTVVPQTTPNQHVTCKVTLTSSPAAGTQSVAATVEPVLGERTKTNNTLDFPVTFQ